MPCNPCRIPRPRAILARLAVVEEVGRREEAGDRLDPAGALVDRVLGIWFAQVARGPLHQRQVPAGRAAADADPVGIDVIVLGMIPDEPNGPVHVLEDLGDRVLGLAAVDDREDRVAPLERLGEEVRVDRIVPREPAAADGPDDRRAVGAGLGGEDIHRQGTAELAVTVKVCLCAYDHRSRIGLAVEGWASGSEGWPRCSRPRPAPGGWRVVGAQRRDRRRPRAAAGGRPTAVSWCPGPSSREGADAHRAAWLGPLRSHTG